MSVCRLKTMTCFSVTMLKARSEADVLECQLPVKFQLYRIKQVVDDFKTLQSTRIIVLIIEKLGSKHFVLLFVEEPFRLVK